MAVGMLEIAQRLRVAKATVSAWQQRALLPEPQWTVGGRPAWEWEDIEAWARETGRLPGMPPNRPRGVNAQSRATRYLPDLALWCQRSGGVWTSVKLAQVALGALGFGRERCDLLLFVAAKHGVLHVTYVGQRKVFKLTPDGHRMADAREEELRLERVAAEADPT